MSTTSKSEIKQLRRALEEAEDAAESAASAIRDATDSLPDEGTNIPALVQESPYRKLISACQWLIQQEFPSIADQSNEQRDLIEALEGCGERAGV